MAKGENKQMLALRGGQPQTAGDPLQHLAGRRPAAPLFAVYRRADAGELRDLFAAQPWVLASRREAKRCRIETLAAGAENRLKHGCQKCSSSACGFCLLEFIPR